MESTIAEMQKTIDALVKANAELTSWKQSTASKTEFYQNEQSFAKAL